jgi:hypothetical protein
VFLHQVSNLGCSLGVKFSRDRCPARQSIGAGAQEWPAVLGNTLVPKGQILDAIHDITFTRKAVVKKPLKHGHKELGSRSSKRVLAVSVNLGGKLLTGVKLTASSSSSGSSKLSENKFGMDVLSPSIVACASLR